MRGENLIQLSFQKKKQKTEKNKFFKNHSEKEAVEMERAQKNPQARGPTERLTG